MFRKVKTASKKEKPLFKYKPKQNYKKEVFTLINLINQGSQKEFKDHFLNLKKPLSSDEKYIIKKSILNMLEKHLLNNRWMVFIKKFYFYNDFDLIKKEDLEFNKNVIEHIIVTMKNYLNESDFGLLRKVYLSFNMITNKTQEKIDPNFTKYINEEVNFLVHELKQNYRKEIFTLINLINQGSQKEFKDHFLNLKKPLSSDEKYIIKKSILNMLEKHLLNNRWMVFIKKFNFYSCFDLINKEDLKFNTEVRKCILFAIEQYKDTQNSRSLKKAYASFKMIANKTQEEINFVEYVINGNIVLLDDIKKTVAFFKRMSLFNNKGNNSAIKSPDLIFIDSDNKKQLKQKEYLYKKVLNHINSNSFKKIKKLVEKNKIDLSINPLVQKAVTKKLLTTFLERKFDMFDKLYNFYVEELEIIDNSFLVEGINRIGKAFLSEKSSKPTYKKVQKILFKVNL